MTHWLQEFVVKARIPNKVNTVWPNGVGERWGEAVTSYLGRAGLTLMKVL